MSLRIVWSARRLRALCLTSAAAGLLASGCVQNPQSLVSRTLSAAKKKVAGAKAAQTDEQVAAGDATKDDRRWGRNILASFLRIRTDKRDALVDPFLQEYAEADNGASAFEQSVAGTTGGPVQNLFVDGFDAQLDRLRAAVRYEALARSTAVPEQPVSEDAGDDAGTLVADTRGSRFDWAGPASVTDRSGFDAPSGFGEAPVEREHDRDWPDVPTITPAGLIYEEMIVDSHLVPPRLPGDSPLVPELPQRPWFGPAAPEVAVAAAANEPLDRAESWTSFAQPEPQPAAPMHVAEPGVVRASANRSVIMAVSAQEQFVPGSAEVLTADRSELSRPESGRSERDQRAVEASTSESTSDQADGGTVVAENVEWNETAEPAAAVNADAPSGGRLPLIVAAGLALLALGWRWWSKRGVRPY